MAFTSYYTDPSFGMLTTHNYNRGSYDSPRANVTKSDMQARIDIEVPGFSRSDITVETKGNVLTVTARKDDEKSSAKQTTVLREFNATMLTRSWTLPKTINAENIEAEYEAGILTLTLPYHTGAVVEPRRIEIR